MYTGISWKLVINIVYCNGHTPVFSDPSQYTHTEYPRGQCKKAMPESICNHHWATNTHPMDTHTHTHTYPTNLLLHSPVSNLFLFDTDLYSRIMLSMMRSRQTFVAVIDPLLQKSSAVVIQPWVLLLCLSLSLSLSPSLSLTTLKCPDRIQG